MIPKTKVTAAQVASIFLDHWVVPCGILAYLLTDNGLQFVESFFETMSIFLCSQTIEDNFIPYTDELVGQTVQ